MPFDLHPQNVSFYFPEKRRVEIMILTEKWVRTKLRYWCILQLSIYILILTALVTSMFEADHRNHFMDFITPLYILGVGRVPETRETRPDRGQTRPDPRPIFGLRVKPDPTRTREQNPRVPEDNVILDFGKKIPQKSRIS